MRYFGSGGEEGGLLDEVVSILEPFLKDLDRYK
jgi:hypothetical protein